MNEQAKLLKEIETSGFDDVYCNASDFEGIEEELMTQEELEACAQEVHQEELEASKKLWWRIQKDLMTFIQTR